MLSITTDFIEDKRLKKGNILLIHRPMQGPDILLELDHAEVGEDSDGIKFAKFYAPRHLGIAKSFEALSKNILRLADKELDCDWDTQCWGFLLTQNQSNWVYYDDVVVLLLKESFEGEEITDACQI